MGAEHAIPELDRAGLRQFGLLMGGFVALVFGLLLPWLFERTLPTWPWLVAAVFGVWSLAAPRSLRPVYKAWMRFGAIMGRITTPLLMIAVFLAVIVPAALIMRLVGRDPLARTIDKSVATYRVPSARPSSDHLDKPF